MVNCRVVSLVSIMASCNAAGVKVNVSVGYDIDLCVAVVQLYLAGMFASGVYCLIRKPQEGLPTCTLQRHFFYSLA